MEWGKGSLTARLLGAVIASEFGVGASPAAAGDEALEPTTPGGAPDAKPLPDGEPDE